MFIINFCLNMFRSSLCPSSGEQRPCVTAFGVLRWFCWMWLVAVVGRCVVVTHGLCSPEDGHNDARNMLIQKLITSDCCILLVFSVSSYFAPDARSHEPRICVYSYSYPLRRACLARRFVFMFNGQMLVPLLNHVSSLKTILSTSRSCKQSSSPRVLLRQPSCPHLLRT